MTDSSDPKIVEEYLGHQGQYSKLSSPGTTINTNIFGNPLYNWVSAVIFSSVEVCLSLEQSRNLPCINWGDLENDFVLVHNPTASYPLLEDIFNSMTQVTFEEGRLQIQGKNIFPTFRNS